MWKIHAVAKMENIFANIIDDSVIMCDQIIEEETKTITQKSTEKMQSVNQELSILVAFLLIAILLLIAAGIYC